MQDAIGTTRTSVTAGNPRADRDAVRRIATAGLATVLAWCALPSFAAAGEEVTVRIHSTAVVTAPAITLADVAEVSGSTGRPAAEWQLGPAPAGGSSKTLDVNEIQKLLVDQGANLGDWVFRGNTRVVISVPAGTRPEKLSKDIPTSRPAGLAADAPLPARNPNTLGGVIEAFIAGQLADLGGTPEIQFPRALGRQLDFARPTYDFKIKAGEARLGMVSLEITIIDRSAQDPAAHQTLAMLLQVSLRKAVVVASRPINRGQKVTAEDVLIRDQVFEKIEDIGLSDTGPVVGLQTKRFLAKGEQIRQKDVEAAPLVLRNDLVTVFVHRGALRIKSSGRAMQNGSYGQLIEIKNEMGGRSGGKFQALVMAEKTVELLVSDERPVGELASGEAGR